MQQWLRLFCLTIAVLLSSPNIVFAQVSSGALFQQTEADGAESSISAPAAVLAPEKTVPKTPAIAVKGFIFQGNELVSSSDLEMLLGNLVGHRIDSQEIAQIPVTIKDYYRARGYLARVSISIGLDDQIMVQITEVSLSKTIVDNQSSKPSAQDLTSWIYDQLHAGQKLNLNTLDRLLLRINDTPGLTAKVNQESAGNGDIILRIVLTDKPAISGTLGADNFGISATGVLRANALLTINAPFGLTDQISIQGIASEGYNYGRVGFATNLADTNLRVGINSSALGYHTVSGATQSSQGSALINSLESYYPIVRSRSANLYVLGGYGQSQFLNQSGGAIQNQYRTSNVSIGISANALDGFFGGGLNSATISAYSGNINLGGSPSQDYFQTAGSFAKSRYTVSRTQNLLPGLSGFVSLGGQVASKNMDPSEQIYLGGPYAVRAYASGQGGGSQGNIASIELKQDIILESQISVFYDYAAVQPYKFSYLGVSTTSYALQGAGVALSWSAFGAQAKLIFAMPTGSLGSQGTTAINNAGGFSSRRIWLSASIAL